MMRTWFKSRKALAVKGRPRRGERPTLEALEDRTVPTFLSAVNYAAGSTPVTPAIGDLDGDGFNDVVVANASSSTVSVYLNNGTGDGSLGGPRFYTVGGGGGAPNGVVLDDVDGDGYLDVVSANYFASTVSVLINNGDGTFQPAVSYAAGPGSAFVTAADVNGDGILDLITANYTGASVSCLLGNGDGTFQPPQTSPTGGSNPVAIASADFDGDGLADVVVPNQSTNNASVLLSNGDGTFRVGGVYATGAFADGVAAGDLNGDGAPDFVVGNANANTVSVLLNNNDGSGSFAPAVNYAVAGGPSAVTLASINHLGPLDIVVEDQSGNQVTVLLGKGDGTFPVMRSYGVGSQPLGVAAGDLTGSTYNSVVTGNASSNNISVLINDGSWRPPVPGNRPPSHGRGSDSARSAQFPPAGSSLAQLPAAVPSGQTVFTDSSWIALLNHHNDPGDGGGWDVTTYNY